jgi:hypothetical protein
VLLAVQDPKNDPESEPESESVSDSEADVSTPAELRSEAAGLVNAGSWDVGYEDGRSEEVTMEEP